MASISDEVAALRGTRPATFKDLLTNKPFTRLAAAMTVSSFGDWVGFVAVSTMVAEIVPEGGSVTGASFAVAGVMIARMLPSLLIGPFIGVIIDRFDRRKVMMSADIGRAVLYATMPLLGSLGSLAAIYVLSFVIESLSLLWSPARDASIPRLVPRRQLANANSVSIVSTYGTLPLSGGVYAILAAISVALGTGNIPTGLEIPYLGANPWALALWLDAGTFIFSAVMLTRVPISIPKSQLRQGEKLDFGKLGRDIMDGVRFIREHPLAGSMTIGIVIAFCGVGAVISLSPLYANSLGAGAAGYGLLVAAFGTGMALGMVLVNQVYKALDKEHVFYLAMIASGGLLVAMAAVPGIAGAVLFAVALGLFVGATWVTGYTLLQETVADEFRGRTFSALNILSKLGLLATLAFFPVLSGSLQSLKVLGLEYSGVRAALAVAGGMVVFGGLYTRVGLHRYRMQKPRPLGLIPKLRKAPPEGVFVVFEGVEGAGKGTQIDLAERALLADGREVLVTREPGGTDLGERLRQMLLAHETGHLEPRTEALLFGAARSQVVATVIRPALEAGKVVLCDRYIDSSLAYQGVARGVGEQDVLTLNVWATQGLFPDLVVLLHLEPEIGLERAGDPDRFEAEGVNFHAKVADAYLHIAEEHPERIVVVDASEPPAEVHDRVMEAIRRVVPS